MLFKFNAVKGLSEFFLDILRKIESYCDCWKTQI